MEIFRTIVAHQIVFVLGIVNLIMALLVLLTCRCMAGPRISGALMKYPVYKWLYKYHCSIWWFFWVSVIVHAVFGLTYFGVPF